MVRVISVFLACIFLHSSAFAADRGAKVFQLCASCHGPDGHGNPTPAIEAPSIAGLPAWYVSAQLEKFRSGQRGKHADDDAGNRMRPLAMTLEPGDVAVVADYVASLPAVKAPAHLSGGNAEKGKATFTLCMACHGPNGEGNPVTHAPPLNMASDWYLLRQLNNFKKHIRAYDPADAFGATMSAQAATLADEQAMKDVLAYIQTLAK
jgi:cytochrome c553